MKRILIQNLFWTVSNCSTTGAKKSWATVGEEKWKFSCTTKCQFEEVSKSSEEVFSFSNLISLAGKCNVHGLGHEIKFCPFSRSPAHASDASGDLSNTAGQIIKELNALVRRTPSQKKMANSSRVVTKQEERTEASSTYNEGNSDDEAADCNGKACQKPVLVERFQI